MSTHEQIAERLICSGCIGEEYLKAEAKTKGNSATCFYCKKVRDTISIDYLSKRIEDVFEKYFSITDEHPPDYESEYTNNGWHREGIPVIEAIAETAEIDNSPSEDIQKVLEASNSNPKNEEIGRENPFCEYAHYEYFGASHYKFKRQWEFFQKRLKTETRFFNSELESFLDLIFEGITEYTTRDTRPIIISAGPDCNIDHIYRARVFYTDNELLEALIRPDKELGPPPSSVANAGRMNAQGISVFYGATNAEVARTEIRPPVGSRVAVVRFEIIRAINLLDLEALQYIYEIGSLFDSSHMKRFEKAGFLRELSKQIVKPVIMTDKASDYLITQSIADYIANRSKFNIDGIIYQPSQCKDKGRNIVLFHKSSKVEALNIPKDMTAKINKWGKPKYYVSVGRISRKEITKKQNYSDRYYSDIYTQIRQPTLRVNSSTLSVHHIQSVNIETEEHSVSGDFGYKVLLSY